MKRNTRHSRVFVVVAIVALASLAAAVRPASAEGFPQARGGWFVGFRFGGGAAGLTAGGQSNDRQGAPSGSFRVGDDLSAEIGLGLETNGRTKSEDVHGQHETDTFSIGPQVDYRWMTLSDFDANHVNFGLSFDWQFIGK